MDASPQVVPRLGAKHQGKNLSLESRGGGREPQGRDELEEVCRSVCAPEAQAQSCQEPGRGRRTSQEKSRHF